MGKKYDFEYIIIGSGPAGSAAAFNLAKAKKRVALIEGHSFGGTNINSRDIPYSVALNFAHTYRTVASSPEFQNQDFHFSLPTAVNHQLHVTTTISKQDKSTLEQAGVTYLKGYVNLLDRHTVALGKNKLTAANFIIATGSHLKTSEITGADTVSYLTPDTALKVRRLPKVALIVGGGSTGCEIASYFASLGTKVIIMETCDRLLPREDKEASEAITNYFTKKLGVMVLPNCRVVAIEKDNAARRVIFQTNRTEKMVRVDCLILATGSEPNLDLGLENAGVKYKNSGIVVDKLFHTSAKNIYAIGDCIGNESSTARADYEGTLLAANITNRTKNSANYRGFLRVTKTYPEVVTIGYNEYDLLRRDRKFKKACIKLSDITASETHSNKDGFVKLIADHNDRIVGACLVSPHAELMAAEISLAIRHNLPAIELATTPYPTDNWTYAIKLAAKQLVSKKR